MVIPFTPAVYEHAARFAGCTPWAASRDPELLFAGHRGAWLEYRHAPIAVGIDIYNLEAEAYGARIEKPEGNAIPAIREPILRSLEEGIALPPFDPERDGRISMLIAVGRRLKRELPEADVRIPVAGPFSIAFNLRGIARLCEDVAARPGETGRFLLRLAENQTALCRAVAAAGLDVAFFESAASPPILSPRHFREVELPALRRAMDIAADCMGHAVPCILGGNTYPILDDLLSTGTSYLVCNVETDQRAFVARVAEKSPGVRVRVNMNPVIVASPEPERILREVDRVLSFAAGRGNCLLGTGALPFETPPENVRLIREHAS